MSPVFRLQVGNLKKNYCITRKQQGSENYGEKVRDIIQENGEELRDQQV